MGNYLIYKFESKMYDHLARTSSKYDRLKRGFTFFLL